MPLFARRAVEHRHVSIARVQDVVDEVAGPPLALCGRGRIRVHGDCRVRVAEVVTDRLDVRASLDRHRGVGMAKSMESEPLALVSDDVELVLVAFSNVPLFPTPMAAWT